MVSPVALAASLIAASMPAVSSRDLTEITDISGVTASPDGRLIAFRTEQASIADNGYRIDWYVGANDGRTPPHRIADGGAALLFDNGWIETQTPIWAPDSRSFFFRALKQGAVQIWRADIATGDATQTTNEAGDVVDMTPSADRRSISYHVGPARNALVGAEQRAYDDGVLVDASVDLAQPLSRGGFVAGKPASQRLTGNWFAHGNLLWREGLRTVVLPLGGMPTAAIPRSAAKRKPAEPNIHIEQQGGRMILSATDPAGRRWRCDTQQCREGSIATAEPLPSGALLVTTTGPAREQTLSIWRPGNARAQTLVHPSGLLSGDRYGDTPCAISQAWITCVAAAAGSPPRLIALSASTGRQHSLFDPNSALRKHPPGRWRRLDWQASDGTAFTGQFLVPATPRPASGYPLAINYYDCPGFIRGGLGDELPFLPLASAGIAGLCINKQLTGGVDRNALADYGHAVGGVTAIVAKLGRDGQIDPHHVGMAGLSYGSEIAMAVAMRTPLLAAISVSTGLMEPAFYWFNGVRGRDTPEQMMQSWQVGAPDTDAEHWRVLSPALNVDRIRAPLLMQLPEQEARWSMELYAKLSRTTTPVELYAYANEPHNKFMPRHKRTVYERNLDWFRYWLQGWQDPDPAKRAQYARWDFLRARSAGQNVPDPELGIGQH